MRNLHAMTLCLALAVLGAVHPSLARPDDGPVLTEILVKFRDGRQGPVLLGVPQMHGAALTTSYTGVQPFDDVVMSFGQAEISRPFPFGVSKSDNESIGLDRWFQLRFNQPVDVSALKVDLETLAEVEDVSLVYIGEPQATPRDSLYLKNWGHNNTTQLPAWNRPSQVHDGPLVGVLGFDTNAPLAWNSGYGGEAVTIAILDDGFDLTHPDIAYVQGYDAGNLDDNPQYGQYNIGSVSNPDLVWADHGTSCAGVAAALVSEFFDDDSAVGIAGNCKIMPIKIVVDGGSTSSTILAAGLLWAVQNNANVISVSWSFGDNANLPAVENALYLAHYNKIPVFASTGNYNRAVIAYPASSQYVIAVGAASPCGTRKRTSNNAADMDTLHLPDPNGVSCDNEIWWGSNYGVADQDARDAVDVLGPTILPTTDLVDVAANGGDDGVRGIAGSYNLYFNGTSCSTPYAAGVAALMKSANPTLSADDVRNMMTSSAIDIVDGVEAGLGWDHFTGYGMVNAAMAVALAGSTPLVVDLPGSGSVLDFGTPFVVAWHGDETYPVISQKLEISYDGGTYSFLDSGSAALAPDVQMYQWTPNTMSDNCRIRLTVRWSDGDRERTPHQVVSEVFSVQGDYRVVSGKVKMPEPWNAGVAGAQVYEGTTLRATTDTSGNFTFTMPLTWMGTLRAEKGSNAFAVGSWTVTTLEPQNVSPVFEMSYLTVSGSLSGTGALGGVTIDAVGGDDLLARDGLTDAMGGFGVWVEYGWSGHLTPIAPAGGSAYEPATLSIAPVTAPVAGLAFNVTSFAKWGDGNLLGTKGRSSENPQSVHDLNGKTLVFYFTGEGTLDASEQSWTAHYDLMFNRFAANGTPAFGGGKVLANDLINGPYRYPTSLFAVSDGADGAHVVWNEANEEPYDGGPTGRYCHVDGAGQIGSISLVGPGESGVGALLACPGGGYYVAYHLYPGGDRVGRHAMSGTPDWDIEVDHVVSMESDGADGIFILTKPTGNIFQLLRIAPSGQFAWQNPLTLAGDGYTRLSRGPECGVYVTSATQCILVGADGAQQWSSTIGGGGNQAIADGDGGLIVCHNQSGVWFVDKIDQFGGLVWGGGVATIPGINPRLCSNGKGGVIVSATASARACAQEVLRDGTCVWGPGVPLLSPNQIGSETWPDGQGGLLICGIANTGDQYLGRYNNADESSYEVRGTVTNNAGNPKTGRTVVLRDLRNGIEFGRGQTDSHGAYSITGLPPYAAIEISIEGAQYVTPMVYKILSVAGDQHCSFKLDEDEWRDASVTVFGGRSGSAGAWGDYDKDGLDDLFLLTSPGIGVLLHNTGAGFVEQAFPVLPAEYIGAACGAAWGDYDNDGDLDLCLVPSDFGLIMVIRNDEDVFTEVLRIGVEGSYGGCSWVDIDGDDDLDVVAYGDRSHYAGSILNMGDFKDMDDDVRKVFPHVVDFPRTMSGCAWGDWSRDGELDLCALGNTGTAENSPILRHEGNGYVGNDSYFDDSWASEVFSAAWIDFDNDGVLDFQQNTKLYRLEAGRLVRVFQFPIASAQDAIYANWADFNSDGWIDVIINGRLYRNDHGQFVDLTNRLEWPTPRPGRWEWVDYDGDGDLDLFSFGSPLKLMENTANPTDGFVKLDLQGTVSNRDGIGAKLRLPIGLRTICQNSGVANSATRGLIGLGDISRPFQMEVTWPSGTQHSVTVSAGTNAISVVEPEGIAEFTSYPIVADGSEHSGVFAVRLSPSSGVVSAAVDLNALGVAEVLPLADDGLGSDLVLSDGIYTSAEFSSTLNIAQYYYPTVTAELTDGTHLARRVDVLLVSAAPAVPAIGAAASAPIWSVGADVATTISVPISVPEGQYLWTAELDLNGLGTPSHLAMSDAGPGADGLGSDQVAGDGIYTSEVFTANAVAGKHQVSVLATASNGGTTHQVVAVDALPYVAKLTNVSNDSQLGLDFGGTPYSAVSVDYDGNGMRDLLLTQSDAPAILYRETDVFSSGMPLFSTGRDWDVVDWRGAVVGDYDNDGHSDVFLAHATNSVLWKNGGNGFQGSDETVAMGLSGLDKVTAACWGDYDRDGWLDLYVARSNTTTNPPNCDSVSEAEHRLYRNCVGEGGGFVDVTGATGLYGFASIPSLSATWVDVDQDGDLDLFVARAPLDADSFKSPYPPAALSSQLFINQDNGTFVEDSKARFSEYVSGVSAAAWADIDNNGTLDLLVAMQQAGARAYLNDGDGYFFASDPIALRDDALGYSGICAVDQDLDGWQDILLTPASAGRSVELLLNEEWGDKRSFVSATAISGLSGQTPALGLLASDFTGDGDPEVFAGMPRASGNFFYKTDDRGGATVLPNSYLKVRLVSPDSTNVSDGIGATVVVVAGALQQIQVVDGGSGRGGQRDRELVFGLGDFTGEVTAKVRWPGGWAENGIVLSDRGENVNVIADNSSPVLSGVSAFARFNPTFGTLDWVFSWDSDVSTNWRTDEVRILAPDTGANCLSGWSSVLASSPSVSHAYAAKAGGGYRHSVTIPNLECNPGCGFKYQVGSGGPDKVYSPVYTKKVKVCPSQF